MSLNLRQSIEELASEARNHRGKENSAKTLFESQIGPHLEVKAVPLSFEEKRRQDLLLKDQIELQKTLSQFFKSPALKKSNPFLEEAHGEQKKKVGRPTKLKSECVQRIGMKLPPDLLKFLRELKIEGGRGFGSKIKAIILEWNALKKREKEQLQTFKKNLDRLEVVIRRFSGTNKTPQFTSKNDESMRDLKNYCSSLLQLANLYSFDDQFLKKKLSISDYKNYQFATFYLRNQG